MIEDGPCDEMMLFLTVGAGLGDLLCSALMSRIYRGSSRLDDAEPSCKHQASKEFAPYKRKNSNRKGYKHDVGRK